MNPRANQGTRGANENRHWRSCSIANPSRRKENSSTQTQHPSPMPASEGFPGQHKGVVWRDFFTSTRPVRFQ